MNRETQNLIAEAIQKHTHDGNESQQIDFPDIFGYVEPLNVISATVATTGNTDTYFLAPRTLSLIQVDFSGVDALAVSDTNYITWSITNLGQDGSLTTAMLDAINTNTTKVTGGSALVANTKRTLVLASSTQNNLKVIQGDRIRIRAAVTGTLANTVTFPVYLLQFN